MALACEGAQWVQLQAATQLLKPKVIKRCDSEKMDRWLLPPDVIVKEQQPPSSQAIIDICFIFGNVGLLCSKPLWHFPYSNFCLVCSNKFVFIDIAMQIM